LAPPLWFAQPPTTHFRPETASVLPFAGAKLLVATEGEGVKRGGGALMGVNASFATPESRGAFGPVFLILALSSRRER